MCGSKATSATESSATATAKAVQLPAGKEAAAEDKEDENEAPSRQGEEGEKGKPGMATKAEMGAIKVFSETVTNRGESAEEEEGAEEEDNNNPLN